jgi:hypothetical protein
MQATFKIQANELNDDLLLQIKRIFEGRPITLYISTEMDETDYLAADPANKQHILDSMVSEPSISFTSDEFEKYVKELLNNSNERE